MFFYLIFFLCFLCLFLTRVAFRKNHISFFVYFIEFPNDRLCDIRRHRDIYIVTQKCTKKNPTTTPKINSSRIRAHSIQFVVATKRNKSIHILDSKRRGFFSLFFKIVCCRRSCVLIIIYTCSFFYNYVFHTFV